MKNIVVSLDESVFIGNTTRIFTLKYLAIQIQMDILLIINIKCEASVCSDYNLKRIGFRNMGSNRSMERMI